MERELDAEHEKLLLDYLAEMEFQATERYLAQGREHGGKTLQAVEQGWLDSFAALSERPSDPILLDRFDCYAAELRLRGVEPPFEQGRGSFDRMIEANDRALAEMRKQPARMKTADAAFKRDLSRFVGERDRARRRPN